ncbi:unnamed protein product [Rotaria sordida]|nr:unnamed protein product [Rotaria sordida]
MYDRNNGTSSNHCRIFDIGKNLSNFDCHSIALNAQETRLLLVGNHELAFINFETMIPQIDNGIGSDTNVFISSSSDIKFVPLFDMNNVNRPIVEWNYWDTNQYAVAIDRLVRLYTVDHAHINETNAIIDTQHQRPISTISYSPHDPYWLLTGSLDGQIQVWDTRHCSAKSPANLKFTVLTPFSIRHIQWSSIKSDNLNQLAVQCDRCIRIYDIRRTDSYLLSTDLEHTQRIISMDWIKHNFSIITLSMDNSIKIYSTNGQVLAESLPNEQSNCIFSKIRTTIYDNLFVCASRNSTPSTYGFLGWRWDGDQCLQPLTNRILSTTPSSIVDFCSVTNPRFFHLFNNSSSSPINDDITNRFLLLTLCRDGNLCLVDMDSTFRQAWTNQHTRNKLINSSDSSSSISISRSSTHLLRQQTISRSSWPVMPMSSIKSETTDSGDTIDDDYDNAFQEMPSSPPNTVESSETSDENDYPVT